MLLVLSTTMHPKKPLITRIKTDWQIQSKYDSYIRHIDRVREFERSQSPAGSNSVSPSVGDVRWGTDPGWPSAVGTTTPHSYNAVQNNSKHNDRIYTKHSHLPLRATYRRKCNRQYTLNNETNTDHFACEQQTGVKIRLKENNPHTHTDTHISKHAFWWGSGAHEILRQ